MGGPLRLEVAGHCLRAVVHAELAEDVLHMGLDRVLGDHQPLRDPRVRLALGEHPEHLRLPPGELCIEALVASRLGRSRRVAKTPCPELYPGGGEVAHARLRRADQGDYLLRLRAQPIVEHAALEGVAEALGKGPERVAIELRDRLARKAAIRVDQPQCLFWQTTGAATNERAPASRPRARGSLDASSEERSAAAQDLRLVQPRSELERVGCELGAGMDALEDQGAAPKGEKIATRVRSRMLSQSATAASRKSACSDMAGPSR